MTGPVPPSPSEGRSDVPPGDERISLGKAVLLLVVAVVVGILCLQVGARPPAAPGAANAASVTTTTVAATTTTTTNPAAPTAAVKILVANGGSANGAATFFTAKLKSDGWGTVPPVDTTGVTTSAVYYKTGQEQAAGTIASELGLPSSAAHPYGTAPTVSGATAADVVVIVGPDLSSQVPSTSSTGSTASSG